MNTVLVVAPHPDDEVLGVGGTMARHVAEGDSVHVVIATRGTVKRFGAEQVERVLAEARSAHAILGVTSHFLDLPAAELDTVPGVEINASLGNVFDSVKPDVVYLPHVGDVHADHQIVFQAAMVCCRPTSPASPARILCYETVSETEWYAPPLTPAFIPNVFVDISQHIDRKIEAFEAYSSQVMQAPQHRSIEALRALGVTRGHAMGMTCAEAFVLVRELTR